MCRTIHVHVILGVQCICRVESGRVVHMTKEVWEKENGERKGRVYVNVQKVIFYTYMYNNPKTQGNLTQCLLRHSKPMKIV